MSIAIPHSFVWPPLFPRAAKPVEAKPPRRSAAKQDVAERRDVSVFHRWAADLAVRDVAFLMFPNLARR